MIARFIAFFLMGVLSAPLSAQTSSPATTLFQNVRIFDGKSGRVTGPSDVLVRGNRIEHDLPRTLGEPGSRFDQAGHTAIADSPDEVRLRTREQLMHGASQIKLTAGGGVTSPHSPLDAVTFTEPEVPLRWRRRETGAPT